MPTTAETTALLVIDMQNFFRPMTVSALPHIRNLCLYFRTHNLPIIFTQHGHSVSELTPPASKSPNQLVRKWGIDGSIAQGSHDWALMEELAEFHSFSATTSTSAESLSWPKLVHKNTYDAFINTNLGSVLQGARPDIERVVVCGVMTDCCCDTTARSAFNRGYETWLVSDACGSANKRQHEAGLRGFGFAFGEVLSESEVVERLQEDLKDTRI